MISYNIQHPTTPFRRMFVYEAPFTTKKLPLIITGKLYVNYARQKDNQLILNIDKTKSDSKFVSKINEIKSFLEKEFTAIELQDHFIKEYDTNINILISECSFDNINLRKPYKVSLKDFITFSNFEIFLSVNIFIMKTYVNYVSGIKLLSLTIPYDKTIYAQYGIKSDLTTGITQSTKFNKYGSKKSDIVENILNILNKKS